MRVLPGVLALALILNNPAGLKARQPVFARNGMVVAEEPLAAEAGRRVLQQGGNAIDAAVAVGLALAVTHPTAGNLGGGGFLLARFADGKTTFIDFRERAPESAQPGMYLDASGQPTRDSIEGWRAAGVPGTVRGLAYAHRKYGRKRWADLVAPSVRLARQGFTVTYGFARSLESASNLLGKFPESRRIFLKGGVGFQAGDRLVQPELAATLQRIMLRGAAGFYEGITARRLAAEMQKHGGHITAADLKNYQATERVPLQGKYRGYQIITAPPPSSGGIGLLQMLGMLEPSGYEKHGAGSAAAIHYVVEVMRRYYADRSEHLGDPDFVEVPLTRLLDPAYVAARRKTINLERATPSSSILPGRLDGRESSETTHFSIVDKQGNAVALTYTLNGSYGSGVTVPGLGFLLNNEMDDFSVKPGSPNMFGLVQGERNAIQPRKRPLSSMTPTIVLRDGKLFLVIGGPGGGRIISSVLQVFLNIVDHKLNVQDAIDRPRFHHQWQPDRITMEEGFSPDTIKLLQSRGHAVEMSSSVARIEAILVDRGWLQGGADGRTYAKAEGY